MKWMEFVCDLVVWGSIVAAILAFIVGIYSAPIWASAMTAILLVAVMVFWD